jgi:hypothetical protein
MQRRHGAPAHRPVPQRHDQRVGVANELAGKWPGGVCGRQAELEVANLRRRNPAHAVLDAVA